MNEWNEQYELTVFLQEARDLEEMGNTKLVDLDVQRKEIVREFFRKNFKKIVQYFQKYKLFNWLKSKLKKIDVDYLINTYLLDKNFREDLHKAFDKLSDIDIGFKNAEKMQDELSRVGI